METNNLIILALSIISGLTTLIGTSLAIFCKNNIKSIVAGMGFSTGIMLAISFFELIPEALGETSLVITLSATLVGLLVLALLNYIIPHSHLIKASSKNRTGLYKVAFLVTFGLILHDFPEGFAMASSYIINPNLGIFVAIVIALHNIPEEFAIAAPAVLLKDRKFLYKAAIISGLAEPAGAVVGLAGIAVLPVLTPIFLAFAAGAMIFVSIHELIPFAQKYKMPVYFIFGFVLSIIVFFLLKYFIS